MSDETEAPEEGSNDEATPPPAEAPATGDRLEMWKHNARENEKKAKEAWKRADDAEKRLAELEDALKSDQEKALEAAAREAEERVRREYEERARAKDLELAVLKVAGGKLNDPDDALRFLDISDLDPTDPDAVAARIDSLLEDKPYLATQSRSGGPKFEQGNQGDSPVDIGSMSPEEYRKYKRGQDAVFNRR